MLDHLTIAEMIQWAHYSGAHPSFDPICVMADFQIGKPLADVYAEMGLAFPPQVH